MRGKIKFFKYEKNFGFITGQDEKDYFFHISSTMNLYEPKADDIVEFQTIRTERGIKAVNIQLIEEKE